MAEFQFSGQMILERWPDLLAKYRAILDCSEPELNIDIRQTDFWEPFGVCTLSAVILHLGHLGRTGVIRYVDGSVKNYLKGVGFLEFWGGEASASRDSITKLNLCEFQGVDDRVLRKLLNIIGEKIPLIQTATAPLYDAFAEIMSNVRAHARSPIGGLVVAQVYPQKKRMKICFADTGIGIRESFKGTNIFGRMPDSFAAIRLAIQENLTSDQSGRHSGLGLSHVRDFAKEHDGTLTIMSQEAYVEYGLSAIKEMTVVAPIPGTVVHLDIDLSRREKKRTMTFEEELTELLRHKKHERNQS